MTKLFRINGKSFPVDFKCEADNCPYTPSLNERCRQCLYLKTRLDAVDFYIIMNEINSHRESLNK